MKIRSRATELAAVFSPCERYRYLLARRWAPGPLINFCMLNPSTADEYANDPTVAGCERRAIAWEFGGLIVTNLFAFRAVDPADMKAEADPIGRENDASIRLAADRSEFVVCAWGAHGRHRDRSSHVLAMLADVELHALTVTKAGEPGHPLYVPMAQQPFPFPEVRQ